MRQRLSLATVLALLLTAAPASAALRTEVRVIGGTLEVRERDESVAGVAGAERTLLALRFDAPGEVVVTKGATGAPIVAVSPCSQRSATEVACPGPEVLRVDITTGLGDDGVDLQGMVGKGAVPSRVDGGAGADSLQGGPGADVLSGDGRQGNGQGPVDSSGGDDLLSGGAGDDQLLGQDGQDGLVGSTAAGERDVLDGGPDGDLFELGRAPGADEVRGGSPTTLAPPTITQHPLAAALGVAIVDRGDVATYERRSFAAAGSAGITADLDAVADDGAVGEGDALTGLEGLVGTVRDDRLTGDAAANLLVGRLGRDKLVAGAGDDTLDLRDGVQDECPSAGTGANTITADLTDERTYGQCTVNEFTFTRLIAITVTFLAVDETTAPAAVGPRLRRRSDGLRVTLTCPRSPQARCAGTLAVQPLRGGRSVGRRRYSVARGRRVVLTVPVGARALARLARGRGAQVVLVERGRSRKGPKTVRAQRSL